MNLAFSTPHLTSPHSWVEEMGKNLQYWYFMTQMLSLYECPLAVLPSEPFGVLAMAKLKQLWWQFEIYCS